jgi:hypothetical protein
MDGSRTARDYDPLVTELCRRAQLTLLACAGPWHNRIYLAGGLVPRYLIQELPVAATPHVGTTDVDFVVGVAVIGEADSEPYRTLENNMRAAGFRQCVDEEGRSQSFRWQVDTDGSPVTVEFMGEDPEAGAGKVFRPKQKTGAKLGAFNARGARLCALDHIVVRIEGRVANGDESFADMRVAGLTPFLMLKSYALHERVKLKDAYDIVFVVSNWPGGPEAAAGVVSRSSIIGERDVTDSLTLLREHFRHPRMDGPGNYSAFLADPDVDEDDDDERRRLHAVEAIRIFAEALHF